MKVLCSHVLRQFCVLAILFSSSSIVAQAVPPIWTNEHGPNNSKFATSPYVILISLDGFRYDYAWKFKATNILKMAEQGASAPDGMIPVYPALTFPNHYSIITGLYPQHSGLVANIFYDPIRKQKYKSSDRSVALDGSWYNGIPLWSLAEKQGMRTACYYWPTCEAEIAGERPQYFVKFEDRSPDDARVDQVLSWLKMPVAQRPHFITLYYSNTDHSGHDFGPDSKENVAAVAHVDALIGRLMKGLEGLNLPVNVILVADHGMEKIQEGDWLNLEKFADLSKFVSYGWFLYPPDDKTAAEAYEKLKNADPRFTAYRSFNLPPEFHYSWTARIGDPVIVLNGPYRIRGKSDDPDEWKIIQGMHGLNPWKLKNMRSSFFAFGPNIKAGVKVEPFENVNIYPLIVKILGLESNPVDGNLKVLEPILQNPN